MLNSIDIQAEAANIAAEEASHPTGKTKIKDHKGGRVWIEGAKLCNAGFTPKQRYSYTVVKDMLVITLDPNGDKVVSGKGKRAIIDICNQTIGNALGLGSVVKVTYMAGIIMVTKELG